MFHERYCVYGCPTADMPNLLQGKEYLHSFLREDSAMKYIADHRNTFPERYAEYDVYVAAKHYVRVKPIGKPIKPTQEDV